METWLESSVSELYKSAVAAFPHTKKRQHATGPVVVEEIKWTPFLGMKTLLARGEIKSGDSNYRPIVLFKNVAYHEQPKKELIALNANDGKEYFLEQLSTTDTDVLVRCDCDDFSWRFNYYNYLDKSLYGRKRSKYEAKYNPGSANPKEFPGLCKHLIKLTQILSDNKIIA